MEPIMAPEAPPAAPAEAVEEKGLERGDRGSLFSRRKLRQKWVTLPSDGKEYLVQAVTPKRMAEVNNACLVEVPAPTPHDPSATKREWDATMRVFYIIASGLCNPDGKLMFLNPLGEKQTEWRVVGAHKVSDLLDNADVEVLYSTIEELSGLGRAARETVGKGSGRTPPIAPS